MDDGSLTSPYSFQFPVNWNDYSFQIVPVLIQTGFAIFNFNNPFQIPVGYYPVPSSHHNLIHHPHDHLPTAETNHRWIRIQEEGFHAWNSVRQYVWLNLLSTYRILQNVLNSRGAHPYASEFQTTDYLDDHRSDFYWTPRDLSEDIITERLKTRSVDTTADEDQGALCAICHDCLFQEKDKIATLDCGHEYHAGCIKNWLIRKNSCPLCNAIGIRLNL